MRLTALSAEPVPPMTQCMPYPSKADRSRAASTLGELTIDASIPRPPVGRRAAPYEPQRNAAIPSR